MAALQPQQIEILARLRALGHDHPAMRLEGLYAQINERPGDAQIIEMVGRMLQQYMRDEEELTPMEELDEIAHRVITRTPEALAGPAMVAPPKPDMFYVKLDTPMEGIGEAGDTVPMELQRHTVPSLPQEPLPVQQIVDHCEPPKVRLELIPFEFIVEMAKVMQDGLSGSYDPPRNPGDWQKYNDEDLEERRGSLLRHYAAGEWPSVAVNACILWWHGRKG